MPYIAIDDRSDSLAKLARAIKVEGLTRSELIEEVRRLNPGVDLESIRHGGVVAVPAGAGPARRADVAPVATGPVAVPAIDFDGVARRAKADAAAAQAFLERTADRLKEAVHGGLLPWNQEALVVVLDAVIVDEEASASGTVLEAFENVRGQLAEG